jgi:type 1 glutamine amidotransferase
MDKLQALLLAGDGSHDPAIAFAGVGDLLEEMGLVVTRTSDAAGLNAAALSGKALFVIHRDGYTRTWKGQEPNTPWMQPHQEEAIESFVLGGGAMLAMHNSGWAYPYRGGYRRTLGGYYIGHPPIRQFHVEVVNHTHPITRGVESYEVVDEQHWLHWDYERVTPLLISQGTDADGRQTVSGWAYQYGLGRVAYLPHGHTLEALQHPMNQRLMRNAVRWLLRMDG